MTLEAYTAGFLDADGTVALLPKAKKSRYPCVSFFNCDRNILEKIQERWGGQLNARTRKKGNVSYELNLIYDDALELLKSVLPFMLHEKKKERAKLLVEHYKLCTPRNGRYTTEQLKYKYWLIERVMSIKMRGVGAY